MLIDATCCVSIRIRIGIPGIPDLKIDWVGNPLDRWLIADRRHV